jgi:hypothetical protein
MLRFIYSGDITILTSIEDLDLLFDIYHLADKVTFYSLSTYFLVDSKFKGIVSRDSGKAADSVIE